MTAKRIDASRHDPPGEGAGPLVSVVIPAYNAQQYVRAAVESALAQTYRPVEVIAIDDGSTDDTAPILAQYGDRIRRIHQANAGLSAARNAGIRAAAGEWVAFLDADDLWDARKLEVQMAAAEPGVDLLHSDCRLVDADGNVRRANLRHEGHVGSPGLADMLVRNHVLVLTAVVRKEVLEAAGGFDERNRLGAEDWQLWLRLAAQGRRFRYVNQVLASYRVHGGNMSRDVARLTRGRLYALRETRRACGEAFGPAERRACRRTSAQVRFDAGWYLYNRGEYAEAARWFWSAVCRAPGRGAAWLYALVCSLPLRRRIVPVIQKWVRRRQRGMAVAP
jgi:GT2 family glycosyltransferase